MRRFLTLAIVAALGALALKRLAEVGNDNLCYEGTPQSSDEEEDLQSQTVEDLGDEVTPSRPDEEIHAESQPVDSIVDEAPPPSDEQIDLFPAVDDLGDEVAPSPSGEEIDLEPRPVDSAVDEAPMSSDEEEDLQSQTVDNFPTNVIPGPWEEEVRLDSQPAGDKLPDGVEIESPSDLDQPPRTGDDWSQPVAPNEEEELRQTRAEVDDRLDSLYYLLHHHKRHDETAA
jgi:hypothetical protein